MEQEADQTPCLSNSDEEERADVQVNEVMNADSAAKIDNEINDEERFSTEVNTNMEDASSDTIVNFVVENEQRQDMVKRSTVVSAEELQTEECSLKLVISAEDLIAKISELEIMCQNAQQRAELEAKTKREAKIEIRSNKARQGEFKRRRKVSYEIERVLALEMFHGFRNMLFDIKQNIKLQYLSQKRLIVEFKKQIDENADNSDSSELTAVSEQQQHDEMSTEQQLIEAEAAYVEIGKKIEALKVAQAFNVFARLIDDINKDENKQILWDKYRKKQRRFYRNNLKHQISCNDKKQGIKMCEIEKQQTADWNIGRLMRKTILRTIIHSKLCAMRDAGVSEAYVKEVEEYLRQIQFIIQYTPQ